METEGHPSEQSSSPFIWFYLRPLVPTPMIGVHNPLLFLQLQPQLRRRRLFSRWFIFQGKPFLSPSLMSCPQLALAHVSITSAAPSTFSSLLVLLLCECVSVHLLTRSQLCWTFRMRPLQWYRMDSLQLTVWSFTLWRGILFLHFQCLHCPGCWAGGGCSSMARLSGRCTEPCEYCDWLSSTDKVAYGTTCAQQPFSCAYGWQLADGMFFPINPRSGCFGPHAPGTVRGGGQLRETRAGRNRPSSGGGGRCHWKERERWVLKTHARQWHVKQGQAACVLCVCVRQTQAATLSRSSPHFLKHSALLPISTLPPSLSAAC